MRVQKYFPFHPEKILHLGLVVLGSGAIVAGGMIWPLWDRPPISFTTPATKSIQHVGNSPSMSPFGSHQRGHFPAFPDVEREMTFSFDPPRPDAALQPSPLLVRLQRTAQSRRIYPPARIDLQYDKGLTFSQTKSPFWVELRLLEGVQIEGVVWVDTPSDKRLEVARFVGKAEISPVQLPSEFPEGSVFRILAEARWLGHDLFREQYGDGVIAERLEFGTLSSGDFVDVEAGHWIAWREGKWERVHSLGEGQNLPIARIFSREEGSLILEGWDLTEHVRLKFSLAPPFPFRLKAEELLTAVRVRSDRQISCMLEKQCLLLKTGDWVLKGGHRWRVLRRAEEKIAYSNEALKGDCFVFERIETRGGQKIIQGRWLSPNRTQALPIEMAAHSQRIQTSNRDLLGRKKSKGKRT